MVSVLERYLNSIGLPQRLQEHKEAVAPKGVLDLLKKIATFEPQRDTLGLMLEGSGNVGESLAGLVSTAGAYVPTNNENTAETARRVREAGFAHPLRAQQAARTGPDPVWAWLAGILGMASDPSNIIAAPVGEASKVNSAAQQALKESARAGFSKEFEHGAVVDALMRQLQPVAEGDEVSRMFADADSQQGLLNKLRGDRAPDRYAEIQAQLEALKGQYDTSPLDNLLANAGDTYREVQRAKEAAVSPIAREMLTTKGPRGGYRPIKRGAISELRANPTNEYLQAVDEAKTAAMPQGPGLPRRGETPLQYKRNLQAMIGKLKADEDTAYEEIRQALYKPETSVLTPEEADQLVGPLDSKGLPTGGTPMPNSLSVLNGRENEFFNAVAPERPELTAALGEGGGTLGPQPPVPGAPTDFGGPPQFAGNVTRPQRIEEEVQQLVNQPAADGSRPELERNYTGVMWDLIKKAIAEGVQENVAAFKRAPSRESLSKQIGSVWSGINIQTPRNIFMDEGFSRWVLRNEGIAQRAMNDNEKIVASRIAAGETKPHLLFGTLGDFLNVLGKDVDDPKFAKKVADGLGASFFEVEADTGRVLDEMNLMQQAGIGLGVQLASPTRAVTGLLTAPGNLLIPMRRKVFQIVNNVTHTSARVAAFEDAFAPFLQNSAEDLLQRAAAEGKNVEPLRGRTLLSGNTPIASEGAFSAEEVRHFLGERYAAEWERMSDKALEAGYSNSRRVLGNYNLEGNLGAAERQIRKFVPFMSWAWRAYPRTAKYALQHPAVTAAILHLYAADREQAKAEGRPGYQVGTVSIDKETPFFGLLASVFTPEQESEIRLNPLALFSPAGGELASIGMDTQDGEKTGYQKASDVLNIVGGSFNPYIQTGAYVTGQDYKAPGNASRYSPIDQYIGNETGLEAPTIQGPLRALRAGVTEALGDKQVDNYDPVLTKANELVLERTGKPISDPSNLPLAMDLRNKGKLYQAAEKLMLEGNARKTAFNAVSPQSVMVTTETKKAQRAAGDAPFSYEDIKQAQEANLPSVVRAMRASNEDFYAQHPEAAVQQKPDIPKELDRDPRLAQWELKNATLKRLAPKSYAAARAAYIKEMGIRDT